MQQWRQMTGHAGMSVNIKMILFISNLQCYKLKPMADQIGSQYTCRYMSKAVSILHVLIIALKILTLIFFDHQFVAFLTKL